MTDPSNRTNHSYNYLYQLSIEQLEELLRLGADASYAQDNENYVNTIVEVILRKESENPSGRLADVQKSWVDFQQHYNSPEGEGQDLYPDEDGTESSALFVLSQPAEVLPQRHYRRRTTFYKLVVVAAVLGTIFVGLLAAQANGIDVFGSIARWTDSTFHFVTSNNDEQNSDYQRHPTSQGYDEFSDLIQSALETSRIGLAMTPSWFPNGFTMTEPIVATNNVFKKVSCSFTSNADAYFNIRYWEYALPSDVESFSAEKDAGDVELYTSAQKSFYIFSNDDTFTATYSDGLFVVSISGNISKEDIKLIIDSMGG